MLVCIFVTMPIFILLFISVGVKELLLFFGLKMQEYSIVVEWLNDYSHVATIQRDGILYQLLPHNVETGSHNDTVTRKGHLTQPGGLPTVPRTVEVTRCRPPQQEEAAGIAFLWRTPYGVCKCQMQDSKRPYGTKVRGSRPVVWKESFLGTSK